jgi:HEAT repeat protein
MCAIWALGQHPASGTNAIPALLSATASPSEGTSCGAIEVLGLLQTDAEHVVPVLIKALERTNPAVRRDAGRSLARFGPQAIDSVPLLQSLAKDPSTKREARETLKRIHL